MNWNAGVWKGLTLAACFLAAGCAEDVAGDAPADGRDDTFLVDGRADAFGVSEGSPVALGVLRLVNSASLAELDHDAGLDNRAASNIVDHRNGTDGQLGTADDDLYDDLVELDETPWVGPATFGELVEYAEQNGYINHAQDSPLQILAPMNTPRTNHASVVLSDGRVLVTGGTNDRDRLSDTEIYDPSNDSWTTVAPMNTARVHHSATLLDDGRVLVTGGFGGSGGGLTSTEIYDPVTDDWSEVAELNERRYHHTATKLDDGRVLVLGGQYKPRYYTVIRSEIYDPTTDTWTEVAELRQGRQQHTATKLDDGRVLVVGGFNQFTDRAVIGLELYDPATDSFELIGTLETPRWDHAVTRLADGRVVVVGGSSNEYHSISAAEIVDPLAGDVEQLPDLLFARKNPAAVTLADGDVAVIGGVERTSRANPVAEIEILNTRQMTWELALEPDTPRQDHTAETTGGQVVVVGGKKARWDDYAPSVGFRRLDTEARPTAPERDEEATWIHTPVGGVDHALPRRGMVYHEAAEMMVSVPGQTEENVPAPTYGLVDGKWEELVSADEGPLPPRSGHRMAYDSNREKIVLFGGEKRRNFYLDDVWEFDGTTWTEVQPATNVRPPAQSRHEMVYDSVNERVVLLPGSNRLNQDDSSMWAWDGSEWTEITYSGSHPFRTRYGFTAVYHQQREAIVLFGGYGTLDGWGDTWEFDGSRWRRTSAGGPGARSGHTMTYDSRRGVAVLHGGSLFNRYGGSIGTNDVWLYDGQWNELELHDALSGTGSTTRGITYDPVRDRIVSSSGRGHTLLEIDRVHVPNRPPKLSGARNQQAHANEPLTFDITADDPDGHPVTLEIEALPDGASFDPDSGQFSWTPRPDQGGTYPVTVTASDGARTDGVTFEIEVEGLRQYDMLPSGQVNHEATVRVGGTLSERRGRPLRTHTRSATFRVTCRFQGPNPGRVLVECDTVNVTDWPYDHTFTSSGEVNADGTFTTGGVTGRVEALQWDDYQMVVTSASARWNSGRKRWSGSGEYEGYLDAR